MSARAHNGGGYGGSRSSYQSSESRYSPYNGGRGGGGRSRGGGRGRGRGRGGGRGGGRGRAPENEFGIKYGQQGASLTPIDWETVSLLPFERNFYSESDATKEVTPKQVEAWKAEHAIESFAGYQDNVQGAAANNQSWNRNFNASAKKAKTSSEYKAVPTPAFNFSDCGFPKIVMNAINNAGFDKPTAIQSATWPMVMGGSNVIGIARTGSGKTLAFLLPVIVHIKAQPALRRGDGPIAVFIAPTRELACQIAEEVKKFACDVRFCAVYGGAKRWDQKRALQRGVEIVIATPGRLTDFLETGVTNFKRVTYAVIDEADRLLDMGFEPQLNAIMNQIRPDRQMCMFSATWPKEVRALAKKYLVQNDDDSDVFQVAVGTFGKLQANEDVEQIIKFLHRSEKIATLKKVIDEQVSEDKDSKILVFISTKKMTNMMADILWEDGYWATCMHGDKQQNQRDKALNDFKTGKMKIMLATDVASRGIHVDDIKVVVNFDFPMNIEDYVHRIGRTGRAGNKGKAISFFVGDTDGHRAKDLIKILKDAKQDVPQELMQYRFTKKSGRGRSRYGGYGGGRRGW